MNLLEPFSLVLKKLKREDSLTNKDGYKLIRIIVVSTILQHSIVRMNEVKFLLKLQKQKFLPLTVKS